jgi:hypothetical protein
MLSSIGLVQERRLQLTPVEHIKNAADSYFHVINDMQTAKFKPNKGVRFHFNKTTTKPRHWDI